MGLKVDSSALTVSAPLSIPLARVEKMVLESESWVLGKLAIWRGRQVPVQRWEDGASLPYLGEALTLRLLAGRRAGAQVEGGELRVTVPAGTEEAIRKARVAWYPCHVRQPHSELMPRRGRRLARLGVPALRFMEGGVIDPDGHVVAFFQNYADDAEWQRIKEQYRELSETRKIETCLLRQNGTGR